MLWGLEGYDPAIVLEALADVGEDQVAEAIRWLTFGAFHQQNMPLDEAGNGQLDQPDDVAARAATRSDDERAIRFVSGLLAADIKLWHLDDVGRVGLQLVNTDNPATHDALEELREQLLKREFFDAREDAL